MRMILHLPYGEKAVHIFYRCVSKTGQGMDFSSIQQVMNCALVCDVDSGAVLVADHQNLNSSESELTCSPVGASQVTPYI